MADNDRRSLTQRWEQFQPTKTMLMWACVGSVVATIAVGFTFGGWVTGGTAQEMASTAGDEARAELAAAVCMENFLASADARTQLAELKDIDNAFRQRQFIEGGEWALMPDRDSVNRRAAAKCAEMLAEWEPTDTADPISEIIEH
jgi:hypothetical protein